MDETKRRTVNFLTVDKSNRTEEKKPAGQTPAGMAKKEAVRSGKEKTGKPEAEKKAPVKEEIAAPAEAAVAKRIPGEREISEFVLGNSERLKALSEINYKSGLAIHDLREYETGFSVYSMDDFNYCREYLKALCRKESEFLKTKNRLVLNARLIAGILSAVGMEEFLAKTPEMDRYTAVYSDYEYAVKNALPLPIQAKDIPSDMPVKTVREIENRLVTKNTFPEKPNWDIVVFTLNYYSNIGSFERKETFRINLFSVKEELSLWLAENSRLVFGNEASFLRHLLNDYNKTITDHEIPSVSDVTVYCEIPPILNKDGQGKGISLPVFEIGSDYQNGTFCYTIQPLKIDTYREYEEVIPQKMRQQDYWAELKCVPGVLVWEDSELSRMNTLNDQRSHRVYGGLLNQNMKFHSAYELPLSLEFPKQVSILPAYQIAPTEIFGKDLSLEEMKGTLFYRKWALRKKELTSLPAEIRIDIDHMSEEEFTPFCASLLKHNGYDQVVNIAGSFRHGIDMIAVRDGIRHAIQCRCDSALIGKDAVQEALSGKLCHASHVAIVMTNSRFSPAAKDMAKKTGVVLWNRDILYRMMKKQNGSK